THCDSRGRRLAGTWRCAIGARADNRVTWVPRDAPASSLSVDRARLTGRANANIGAARPTDELQATVLTRSAAHNRHSACYYRFRIFGSDRSAGPSAAHPNVRLGRWPALARRRTELDRLRAGELASAMERGSRGRFVGGTRSIRWWHSRFVDTVDS